VGLVAAELERRGVSTVVIQLLRLVTEKVRPPRALVVPYRHGYPLDSPNDPYKQRAVITAALNLIANPNLTPPAIVEYGKQNTEDR
jgi:hypothetical protein